MVVGVLAAVDADAGFVVVWVRMRVGGFVQKIPTWTSALLALCNINYFRAATGPNLSIQT